LGLLDASARRADIRVDLVEARTELVGTCQQPVDRGAPSSFGFLLGLRGRDARKSGEKEEKPHE
jgi:hypothetical protein